jgi:oligopeptide/dipeptide ABC transporter ATP-binding protein
MTVTSEALGTDRLAIDRLSVELRRPTGTVQLISDVSLEFERGSVLGLIGESGSGKTMTCRAIAGALPQSAAISAGEIRVGGSVLRRAGRRGDRQKTQKVGMIFADPHASLDPLQRSEMLRQHRNIRGGAARKEVLRLLTAVKLPDPERITGQFPFELSGGMAQRAMIASVIAAQPQFLLADEPTSALDSTVQLDILELLAGLVRTEGIGILLTTHDMAVVAAMCDRIGVMYAGKIAEIGPAPQVLDDPQHPYTRLLMRARPRGTKSERLTAIPGEAPAPGSLQGCCRFHPRCPWAQDVCRTSEPPLEKHGDVAAACHFAGRLPEVAA